MKQKTRKKLYKASAATVALAGIYFSMETATQEAWVNFATSAIAAGSLLFADKNTSKEEDTVTTSDE